MLNTPEEIPFYHGTSDQFARRIISAGVSNHLERIGGLEFAGQLYGLLMSRVSKWTELGELFVRHGSKFWTSAPIGLKNISDGYQRSLITYGSFYTTLNPQIAVSYATRNTAGSELLSIIQDSIRILRACGETRVEHLLDQRPELRAALAYDHRPVVLELRGLSLTALETEDGRAIEDMGFINLCRELMVGGGRLPSAFRVKRASADNIFAVYPIPEPIPTALCDPANLGAQFDHALFQSLKLGPRVWMQRS